MNRREFTIKSILGTTGLSLISWTSVFSKSTSENILSFEKPFEHVRHGLLSLDGFYSIPQLNIKIKRDLFYSNGINKCINKTDPILTTIQYKNRTISFFTSEKKVRKGGLKVQTQFINNNMKEISLKKGLLINITGKIKVGDINISENSGIVINKTSLLTGNGEYMIIELLS